MTLSEELRAAAKRQHSVWNGDYHLLMRAAARLEILEREHEAHKAVTVKVVAEVPVEEKCVVCGSSMPCSATHAGNW